MRRFFEHMPEKGKPLSLKGIAEGLRRLSLAWENAKVSCGHIEWSKGYIPTIVIDPLLADVKPRTDTEATAELVQKRRSLENVTDPTCTQLYDFDGNEQVLDALPNLIEADPVTGVITSKTGADKYEMLVRTTDDSGNIKVLGYMSLAPPSNPVDPTDIDIACGEQPYPSGDGINNDGDGSDDSEGVFGETTINSNGDIVSDGGGSVGDGSSDSIYGGDGSTSNDSTYPGKTGSCW